MSGDLQILRDLTEIARTAGSLGGSKGRYARTPDFSAPSHPSSRPKSDRGVTFHFAHKTISKTNDVSDSNFTQTTSSAHQGYIERPSATEHATPIVRNALLDVSSSGERDYQLQPGFSYPGRLVDPSRISFGTLGKSKAERKNFWQKVENSEARKSRVQSRIIAELPVELDALARSKVARDFCIQTFETKGLPYWATLHAPTAKNDARNYHLHITYFDRPAGQNEHELWDFAMRVRKQKKSRNFITTRPYRNDKHPATRAINWPKVMRTDYADILNEHLSIANVDKRHDPRSYKESGIAKEPTEHLGNKCSAFESFGLDTEPGKRNARKEIRWRFTEAEQPWIDRAKLIETSPVLADPALSELKVKLIDIAGDGITTSRRSTSHMITAELLSHRFQKRDVFLDEEILRITQKDDVSRLSYDSQNAVALQSESLLLNDRKQRISQLENKCRSTGLRLARTAQKLRLDFDSLAAGVDIDDIFNETDEHGFEPIENLVETTKVIEEDDPFLEGQDLDDIEEFLINIAGSKTDQSASEGVPITEQKDLSDAGVVNTESGDESTNTKDPFSGLLGTRTKDPIEAIILQLAQQDAAPDMARGASQPKQEDFPGTLPIAAATQPEDVKRLDQTLRGIDNRSLRMKAIANRDATDICPAGGLRDEFNRGWVVLRFEAERRGLDLDTGIHDPGKATDKDRAALHRDQEPCPLRVIRKDLARQRLRT